MNKITVVITVILSAIIMLLLGVIEFLVGSFTWFMNGGGLDELIYLLLIPMGLAVAASCIPTVISGVLQAVRKQGKAELVCSSLLLLVGVIMILSGIVLEIAYYLIWSNSTVGEKYAGMLQDFSLVIVTALACCLILLPVLRAFTAQNKRLQYRVEMHKPVIGVLVVGTLLCYVFVDVLDGVSGRMMQVLGVAAAVFAIVHLVVGLVGLTKAVKSVRVPEDVPGREESPVPLQESKGNLPFNLPAGVRRDDL